MHSILVPSVFLLLIAAAIAAPIAFAQLHPSKARCEQLIKYFDYYGQSRGEGVTDGARNMTRIGARIDCDKGHYLEGIAAMETLLREKRMGVPDPDWGR